MRTTRNLLSTSFGVILLAGCGEDTQNEVEKTLDQAADTAESAYEDTKELVEDATDGESENDESGPEATELQGLSEEELESTVISVIDRTERKSQTFREVIRSLPEREREDAEHKLESMGFRRSTLWIDLDRYLSAPEENKEEMFQNLSETYRQLIELEQSLETSLSRESSNI